MRSGSSRYDICLTLVGPVAVVAGSYTDAVTNDPPRPYGLALAPGGCRNGCETTSDHSRFSSNETALAVARGLTPKSVHLYADRQALDSELFFHHLVKDEDVRIAGQPPRR